MFKKPKDLEGPSGSGGFEGLPVVVRVSSEGDLELLEELVHAGEQRLRRARLRRQTGHALENDHLLNKRAR